MLLDQVVVLSRLGRVGGWGPSAALADISAVIERPRTFYVLGGGPVRHGHAGLQHGRQLVGLLTLRQVDPGRSSMFSMMGGAEAMGLLPVILPAADVLEIAKQATRQVSGRTVRKDGHVMKEDDRDIPGRRRPRPSGARS